MVTCDVEMEDTDRQDFEVENSTVQDSESKCMDVDSQSNEGGREDIASVDLVAGDVSKSQTGEEGVLEQRDGTEEEMVVKCEMKDLVGDKIESCDNKEVHKFNGEQISDIKDNKETQMDDQGQDAAENIAQKQDDANNDVFEEKSAIDRVGEEMTGQNGAGGASRDVSTLEESHNGETTDDKPKSTGRDEGDCIGRAAGKELLTENDVEGDDDADKVSTENEELASKVESDKYSHYQNGQSGKVSPGKDSRPIDSADVNGSNVITNEPKEQNKVLLPVLDGQNYNIATVPIKHEGEDSSVTKQDATSTPSSDVRYPGAVSEQGSETAKTIYTQATLPLMAEDDDGAPEEQAAFMKEVESVYREKAIDFKPPKFYGQPLNCLKLWRAVIRLGGYDRVTASKLWRQVGESFHPPKTCTTVSWTFRIFYEKSLLEFERYKTQRGELQLPIIAFPEASGVDIEGNGNQGSGRVKRDAASRAMQGWHNQRLVTNGEGGEPVAKDKSVINAAKREREKAVKGSLKQKRPNEVERPVKAARIEPSKQLAASIVDIGPPADWVKINIRETKDCFEVYALVPGLLREEVRVQSDPAGRLVITGQPEQTDNPWGITAFKKVVSLPGRIDPLLTSAVVSLHGRLFVRVPFEKPNNI